MIAKVVAEVLGLLAASFTLPVERRSVSRILVVGLVGLCLGAIAGLGSPSLIEPLLSVTKSWPFPTKFLLASIIHRIP